MVCLNLLAGGYGISIALYCFDPDTPSLSLIDEFSTGYNPSWITFNGDKSVLYATNEYYFGGLQSFTVDPSTGVLSNPIQTISSGGIDPAHVVVLGNGQISVTNYNSGNGKFVSTTTNQTEFVDEGPMITFPRGPTSNASHPHQSLEHNGEIFIPDLGADQVWRLGQDADAKTWSIKGSIPQAIGNGPRHAIIQDDMIFVLNELSSTLTVQKVPVVPGEVINLDYIANVSVVPSYQPPNARYQAAEILIPEPTDEYPVPYIYVSNRNTGSSDPMGDSIAIFEFKEGRLELINQFFTGLSQIRGMEFDMSLKYLAASGVVGTGGTKIFKRTDCGKNFTLVTENLEVPTRTSFLWV